ncbi:MAG: RNA polymerase sigma factor [Candidatus Riflebacteria bacterium]|nr:RNA polymerase sigma factor [Candidatus Riflebacteria bacterium]
MPGKKRRLRWSHPAEPPEQRPLLTDPRRFARVVEDYQNLVFRYVYNMVHDSHQAEDLTQDIFVKVYQCSGSYNSCYPFKSWLFKIAHNHVIDHIRKRRLQTVSYDSLGGEDGTTDGGRALRSVGYTADDGTQRAVILEAIYSLPGDYYSVIHLRYEVHMRLEEISRTLEIPIGTVKSRINRARQLLQRMLRQVAPAVKR